MTVLRQPRHVASLLGFAFLLLTPGVAIRCGLLPFEFRFEALLIVSGLCIASCALAGFSLAELGLGRPSALRHWAGCGALTLALACSVLLESRLLDFAHRPSDWIGFRPSTCWCRAPVRRGLPIDPQAVADRLQISGRNYVLYSSIIFSLMHNAYGDPVLLVNTFFAGLAWSAAYVHAATSGR